MIREYVYERRVGPTLGKFYNKLIRFNSSDGINIVQENEGIAKFICIILDTKKVMMNLLLRK